MESSFCIVKFKDEFSYLNKAKEGERVGPAWLSTSWLDVDGVDQGPASNHNKPKAVERHACAAPSVAR
jgi:hypothetical protein